MQLWNEPDPAATDRTITIKDVLYIPGLKANLLSCSSFWLASYDIIFKGNKCRAMRDGSMELKGSIQNGINIVHGKVSLQQQQQYNMVSLQRARQLTVIASQQYHECQGDTSQSDWEVMAWSSRPCSHWEYEKTLEDKCSSGAGPTKTPFTHKWLFRLCSMETSQIFNLFKKTLCQSPRADDTSWCIRSYLS